MPAEATHSADSTWSGHRPFVGRQDTLDALGAEVDRALEDGGRILFLIGPAGSGKSECLKLFQELAYRRHRKLEAEYVDCSRSGGRTWLELAELFTREDRLKAAGAKVLLEWIDAVPLLGPVITAVRETVTAIRRGAVSGAASDVREPDAASALRAVRMLMRYDPREPRLMILDSLERGDAEDLAGVTAMLRRLPDTRTLLVAGVRSSPRGLPDTMEDLILETERLGYGRRMALRPLTIEEIGAAVREATGFEPSAEWREWLQEESAGVPGRLWALLGELQSEGRFTRKGKAWAGMPPERALRGAANADWLDGVDDSERRLLALAAIEGRVFHSAILADLAGESELEIEDRLARLIRLGICEYHGVVEGDGLEPTSRYEFCDQRAAEALLYDLTDGDRHALTVRARALARGIPTSPA